MALQDILKKILADADTEVAQLKKAAEADYKELEKDAKAQEASALKELESNTEAALNSIEDKTRSIARREKSKTLLQKKQEIVQSLLAGLQKSLEALPDEKYAKIITPLLAKIPDNEGTILAPKARVSVTEKSCPQEASFTVKADDRVVGGFIFSAPSGEVDNSFESLINSEFRSSLEIYFAEQLKFI